MFVKDVPSYFYYFSLELRYYVLEVWNIMVRIGLIGSTYQANSQLG